MKETINSDNNPFSLLIRICLLGILVPCYLSNLVISISMTSKFVGQQSVVTTNIFTSTNISRLDIHIQNVFTIADNPVCLIDGITASCSRITMDNEIIVRFNGFTFTKDKSYLLSFATVNPLYSDTFYIRAANSGGANSVFFNSAGQITIQPNQISCSMTSASSIVGQSTIGTLTLGVKSLPSSTIGRISLTTPLQTNFPKIFISGAISKVNSNRYNSQLFQIFGKQVLTIKQCPVGKVSGGLLVQIENLRNPPFNSTFETITIQIQDQNNRTVEKCSIVQPAPSVLKQSSYFVMEGWQPLVGQVSSNVEILITPYYTPLAQLSILMVYPSGLIVASKTPAIRDLDFTCINTQLTCLLMTNVTYQQGILKINATVTNPTSAQPISIDAYIMFNKTHFREHIKINPNQFLLTPQTMQITNSLDNPQTLTATNLNITITSPINVSNANNTGTKLKINLERGQISCQQFITTQKIQSTNLLANSIQNCTENTLNLIINSSITANTPYWFRILYISQQSVRSNNLSVKAKDVNQYQIMSGNGQISVSQSNPTYNITNENTTFTANTNFIVIQKNITAISSQLRRTVQIQPPTHVLLTENTTVEAHDGNTVIISVTLDISINKLVVTLSGIVSIRIKNMRNPTYYQFFRSWTVLTFDVLSNPSTSSVTTHSPQFSPATSSIKIANQSNKTIQQQNNITLTVEPLLQYDFINNPPTLIIQFIGTSIKNVALPQCPGCTLLTSTKFQLLAYSVVMEPMILVKNSENPENNIINFQISLNGFIYERGTINYQLQPIVYSFTSNFIGLYQEVGTLAINLTTNLGLSVQLSYSGNQTIFQSDFVCSPCNSTYLGMSGIVKYFTSTSIIVEGRANGVLYARGVVPIEYTCFDLSGCQLCQTENTTLVCNKCFPQSLSKNYLLYQEQCFTKCPIRTYQNGVLCSSCQALCYRCQASLTSTSTVQCLQCETPYYLYSQTCVLECPPGYIKNATHCLPRPIICPQNCISCPEDNKCNECDADYLLLDDLCYTQCPEEYIVDNEDNGRCQLFVPPQQIDYFPFAFFLAAIIILILLIIIQRFERRSLVMGNFIAITSLLEIGALIMMISYTFSSINNDPDRWIGDQILTTQALLFIAILTKIVLNLAFMAYFLVKITPEQNFQNYIKQEKKKNLYIVLMVFSSTFSFQSMRILYSRLLGLEIFYGRFNTVLVFKPINYFSLAYILPGGCFCAMAVTNLIMQDGYRTSIFYSSIQVILIELVIAISCIIQGYRIDKQFFDYQNYKVKNLDDDHFTTQKIDISYQQENGGSMSRLDDEPTQVGGLQSQSLLGSGVNQSQYWRQKTYKFTISEGDQPIQEQQADIQQQLQNQSLQSGDEQKLGQVNQQKQQYNNKNNKNNKNTTKTRSIFRQKILKQWQSINKNMQNRPNIFRRKQPFNSSSTSREPSSNYLLNHLKAKQKQIKQQKAKKVYKSSSLRKIQVKSPMFNIQNKSQLKKHFYRIIQRQGQSDRQQVNIGKQSQGDMQSGMRLSRNIFGDSEGKTIAENQNQYQIQNNFIQEYQQKIGNNQLSQIKDGQSQTSIQNLLALKTNIKTNRYDDFNYDQQDKDNYDDLEHYQLDINNPNNKDKIGGVSEYLPKRKYKNKRVNKQTEAVYLQRLMSSQAPKRMNKGKRIDDF